MGEKEKDEEITLTEFVCSNSLYYNIFLYKCLWNKNLGENCLLEGLGEARDFSPGVTYSQWGWSVCPRS